MTIRNVVLGLTMVCGLGFWAWSRPGSQAQARDLTVVHAADEAGICATGGNHDEAIARFRTNQSTHWRQVALGKR